LSLIYNVSAYLIFLVVYVQRGLIVKNILDDYWYTLIFRLLHEHFNNNCILPNCFTTPHFNSMTCNISIKLIVYISIKLDLYNEFNELTSYFLLIFFRGFYFFINNYSSKNYFNTLIIKIMIIFKLLRLV